MSVVRTDFSSRPTLSSKDEPRCELDLSGISVPRRISAGRADSRWRLVSPRTKFVKPFGHLRQPARLFEMTIKPNVFKSLAGAEGFELSTYGFGDRRSNQLS